MCANRNPSAGACTPLCWKARLQLIADSFLVAPATLNNDRVCLVQLRWVGACRLRRKLRAPGRQKGGY